MPDSPPISATPVRPPSVTCSTAMLTHDRPPNSQAQINVVSRPTARVYSVIHPPLKTQSRAPPPEDIHQQTQRKALSLDDGFQIRGLAACEKLATSPMTGEQGIFPTPRKFVIDSTDERLQEAQTQAKATVKSSKSKKQGNRTAGSGESSSDIRGVEEGAARSLIRHENEAGHDGGETKQDYSPEAQDATPQEDGNNGSSDSRGEGNTDRPSFAQDDANRFRKEDRNLKRRRSSSLSKNEEKWIVSSKRTRRNSTIALSAI